MTAARQLAPSGTSSHGGYIGRFAPSPTGLLHAGSFATALASWMDARAHGGRWLVRIEDIDTPRCVPGADRALLAQFAACGLVPDEPAVRQSTRSLGYERALTRLMAAGWAYPCGCTRADIAQALALAGVARERHADLVYPGTCRSGLRGKPARAMRLLTSGEGIALAEDSPIVWHDRRLDLQQQDVAQAVGDFVLRRADGLWAYQLAVVVDDAEQGITDIVRGEDLADNTPRQILLQRLLGLPTPRYLHTPLVLGADGEKLSKQNGAEAIDTSEPMAALVAAGAALGLRAEGADVAAWLANATASWRSRWIVQHSF